MKKPQFEKGYFYHIYNRGVEKRTIFGDNFDYFRFIHDLYEFNDSAPAGKFSVKRSSEVQPPKIRSKKVRDILVKIHCFCLMPNHYHLLLEQVRDGGIIQFMKKIGTGYSMYFNEKYDRVGPLFQGRFKAIFIEEESYLTHLSRYIHLNPAELIESHWKETGIKNWQRTNRFLDSYRWSSYPDYIGKNNFPSVITKEFISALITSNTRNQPQSYKEFTQEWLAKDIYKISDITLE